MKTNLRILIMTIVVALVAIPQSFAQVKLPLKVVLDDPSSSCRMSNNVVVTLFFRKGADRDFVSVELNHCCKKAQLNYKLLYPSYGGNFSNFDEQDVWGLQIEYNKETFFVSQKELSSKICWDLSFSGKPVKFHFTKGKWIISIL